MLILASQSPRRRELLGRIGLEFTVRAADIDETMDENDPPEVAVARISAKKAAAVEADESDVVLAADTIVVLDGAVLGKPKDAADAARMLRMLAGRTHRVMTGVTVRRGDKYETRVETTDVTFRPLREKEIAAYVATGEPMDKAGAYGVQGKASIFVSGLRGDYFNVMGLPLCLTAELLRTFGVEVF
ncbi:MAG: septum formation inhibitor Maf [Oscillospiraceae bacterium]|nr:septum formation inhibitor Maf [Oscillospiraceae bacterium]